MSLSFTSGVVQYVYQSFNGWGNICPFSTFGLDEASVICHQLSYAGASKFAAAYEVLWVATYCNDFNTLTTEHCSYEIPGIEQASTIDPGFCSGGIC